MNLRNEILSFLFILIAPLALQAQDQVRKEYLLKVFDYAVFNPDSTLRGVYMIEDLKYDGFSIEFDSAGRPKAMGEYERGLKQGSWKFFEDSLYVIPKDGDESFFVDIRKLDKKDLIVVINIFGEVRLDFKKIHSKTLVESNSIQK